MRACLTYSAVTGTGVVCERCLLDGCKARMCTVLDLGCDRVLIIGQGFVARSTGSPRVGIRRLLGNNLRICLVLLRVLRLALWRRLLLVLLGFPLARRGRLMEGRVFQAGEEGHWETGVQGMGVPAGKICIRLA